MKLLIISHTPHYMRAGQPVGWGPTVREIDQLARLFDQVEHLAVLYDSPAPASSLPYSASNVRFLPVPPAGGDRFADKLGILKAYPFYWREIQNAVRHLGKEDIVHVRCPANISLLALLFLAIHRHPARRWVKYAGNWQPRSDDHFSYAFQRWLLNHNLVRAVVTINGQWHRQPGHVYSFYNPSYAMNGLPASQPGTPLKKLSQPYRLLFVGGVNEAKGAQRAVQVAQTLIAQQIPLEMDIIGDGELKSILEEEVSRAGLENAIRFHGALPPDLIKPYYDRSHFIILPSRTEGWPKVLSEAMAYGVVPLGPAVSSVPQILQECQAGCACDPFDVQAFVSALNDYIAAPQRWQAESLSAREAAHQFTYEAYLDHLVEVFEKHWQAGLSRT